MEKVTFEEVRRAFREYNKEHNVIYGCSNDVPEKTAVIVYKQSNFTKPYTEEERSYRVTNKCGKAFFSGMLGSSILGDCLDGSEFDVRLDAYRWDIDYCYFE